ncbi:hypothetical protein DFH07DRAFT_941518 [Mycena maculata]|uniref:Uncharacterized protein n=1 Tax=Mycena maculata TaxID=230809 RepID=A0AAD7IYZ4_9AGAR|nr:hypothetical protein DFH07DRAFT_941518 [Mycena maculata]
MRKETREASEKTNRLGCKRLCFPLCRVCHRRSVLLFRLLLPLDLYVPTLITNSARCSFTRLLRFQPTSPSLFGLLGSAFPKRPLSPDFHLRLGTNRMNLEKL